MKREASDDAQGGGSVPGAAYDGPAPSAMPVLATRLQRLEGWSALLMTLTAAATFSVRIWSPPSSNPTSAIVGAIVSTIPMLLVAWCTWTRVSITARIRRATNAHPAGVCPYCLHALDPAVVDERCAECGAFPGRDRIEGPRPREEWLGPRVDLVLFGLWALLALTLPLLALRTRVPGPNAAALVEGVTRSVSIVLAIRLVPSAWRAFKQNLDGRRRVRRAIAEASRRRVGQSSRR